MVVTGGMGGPASEKELKAWTKKTLDDIERQLKEFDRSIVDIESNHAMYHGDDDPIHGKRMERSVALRKTIKKILWLRHIWLD